MIPEILTAARNNSRNAKFTSMPKLNLRMREREKEILKEAMVVREQELRIKYQEWMIKHRGIVVKHDTLKSQSHLQRRSRGSNEGGTQEVQKSGPICLQDIPAKQLANLTYMESLNLNPADYEPPNDFFVLNATATAMANNGTLRQPDRPAQWERQPLCSPDMPMCPTSPTNHPPSELPTDRKQLRELGWSWWSCPPPLVSPWMQFDGTVRPNIKYRQSREGIVDKAMALANDISKVSRRNNRRSVQEGSTTAGSSGREIARGKFFASGDHFRVGWKNRMARIGKVVDDGGRWGSGWWGLDGKDLDRYKKVDGSGFGYRENEDSGVRPEFNNLGLSVKQLEAMLKEMKQEDCSQDGGDEGRRDDSGGRNAGSERNRIEEFLRDMSGGGGSRGGGEGGGHEGISYDEEEEGEEGDQDDWNIVTPKKDVWEDFSYTGSVRKGAVTPTQKVPTKILRPSYIRNVRGVDEWKGDGMGNLSMVTEVTDDEVGVGVPERRLNTGSVRTGEIDGIRAACGVARQLLDYVVRHVAPGVTTEELDILAHQECVRLGAYPSPLLYHGFPKSICTSVNEVMCHGIPDSRRIRYGDVLSIDVTVYFGGFHGDCAETVIVGIPPRSDDSIEIDDQNAISVDVIGNTLGADDRKLQDKRGDVIVPAWKDAAHIPKTKQDVEEMEDRRRLVTVAYGACMEGVKVCRAGQRLSVIGRVIEDYVTAFGYSSCGDLCGHGIGRNFHEYPSIMHVRNYFPGELKEGMTITVEPVVCEGRAHHITWPDQWTVATVDGLRSAQFEHTILITEDGCDVLTGKTDSSPEFDYLDNYA
eukprot:GHVQ01026852.1.p1 GENE.GHVQ01026852.1~~GHVQ01026852.1.p1  ORF type:complete len:814 (-),score=123.61 GHVQ01026852.1:2268-4709(-)